MVLMGCGMENVLVAVERRPKDSGDGHQLERSSNRWAGLAKDMEEIDKSKLYGIVS
jgi:hypothetical protein